MGRIIKVNAANAKLIYKTLRFISNKACVWFRSNCFWRLTYKVKSWFGAYFAFQNKCELSREDTKRDKRQKAAGLYC